jgi:hypothetical protein
MTTNIATTLVALTCLIYATGCVSHPMGLSAEQWNALPAEKQAELQAKQYAIDAERQQQREAQAQERARLAAEAAARERERVVTAYSQAQYGDIITLNITGARMYYGKTVWPCQAASCDLVKGERKEIKFTGYDPASPSRRLVQSYWISLSDDAHTFTFNDDSFGEKLVLIDDGWRNGRTYRRLGTPRGSRVQDLDIGNMTIHIRYRDVNDGQRTIIEHRF